MATYFPDKDKPFPLIGLGVVIRHATGGAKQVLALRPGAWAEIRNAKREKTGYEQTFAGLFETGDGMAVSYKVTVNVRGAEFSAEPPAPFAVGAIEGFVPSNASIMIRSALPDGSIMGQPLTLKENGKLNGRLVEHYGLRDVGNKECGLGYSNGVVVTVSSAQMIYGKRKANGNATGLTGTEFESVAPKPETVLSPETVNQLVEALNARYPDSK